MAVTMLDAELEMMRRLWPKSDKEFVDFKKDLFDKQYISDWSLYNVHVEDMEEGKYYEFQSSGTPTA